MTHTIESKYAWLLLKEINGFNRDSAANSIISFEKNKTAEKKVSMICKKSKYFLFRGCLQIARCV